MLRLDQQASLPPLPKLPAKEMAGPTPWSNWVIPGRVIAGAYPASLDDQETERILTTMLELGMNTFVCLQAEVNINTPEHAWRAQHGLRPYIKDAQKILSKAHETASTRITQQKIDFLHLPIIDGNVTTDSAMNRLAEDCMERVLRGEKMYIHCWGGHGRTGTLVAVMLGRLYNMPYTTALRYTQAFHDSRVYPQGVRSPQTPVQRAQVRRLLAAQSAVASSAPNPVSNSLVNGIGRPLVAAAPAPVQARPVVGRSGSTGLYSGGLISKQAPSSVLAAPAAGQLGAGGIRTSADAGRTGPSPARSRTGSAVSSGANPARVGSSLDLKSGELGRLSGGVSVVDKLAGEMSKLQAPSAAQRSGVGAYLVAQR